MILVDSSVWIAHMRGLKTLAVAKLAFLAETGPLLTGDLILLEVLRGTNNDRHALQTENYLRQYQVVTLLDADLAVRAAQNYRSLRSLGITIHKTPDLIIGTYCIEHSHYLLHDDRDFAPMEQHLGLRVI